MEREHSDFYRIVDVTHPPETAKETRGWRGVIVGVSDEEEEMIYAVYFEHISETYTLPEGAFSRTTTFVKREHIYSGETVRVFVDESGEGRIAE